MMRQSRSLSTEIPLLRLVPLSIDDVDIYYALIDRNRHHLTQHGDYRAMQTATHAAVSEELSAETPNLVMGIWLDRELIGRVDLVPKEPGIFVIGYWLGEEFLGRGYMTAACRALIEHARATLVARTIYAGVTKGNRASEALLTRLGFSHVQDMGTYNRFRLELP